MHDCEEVAAPPGFRKQVALYLWLFIFIIIEQEVAGSASGGCTYATATETLFEESEAVRPQKKKLLTPARGWNKFLLVQRYEPYYRNNDAAQRPHKPLLFIFEILRKLYILDIYAQLPQNFDKKCQRNPYKQGPSDNTMFGEGSIHDIKPDAWFTTMSDLKNRRHDRHRINLWRLFDNLETNNRG